MDRLLEVSQESTRPETARWLLNDGRLVNAPPGAEQGCLLDTLQRFIDGGDEIEKFMTQTGTIRLRHSGASLFAHVMARPSPAQRATIDGFARHSTEVRLLFTPIDDAAGVVQNEWHSATPDPTEIETFWARVMLTAVLPFCAGGRGDGP